MNYRHIPPSAAVSRFVEFYWTLEGTSFTDTIQRIIPDGRAGLILNFADPFESYSRGAWRRQPQSFFVGQITGPLLLRPSGPAAMLGIQFRPHGAAQLLRLPVRELNDVAVPLVDLCPRLFRQLEESRDFENPGEAIAAVERAFRYLAERCPPSEVPLDYAIGVLDRTRGLMRLRHLAQQIGWSSRQLQRRFKDAVGISAKLFARMQRFQTILHATDASAPNWVVAALDSGYYDQSHLIRDFREFAGKTPTALLDEEIDLTRQFIRNREMSHFSKTQATTVR